MKDRLPQTYRDQRRKEKDTGISNRVGNEGLGICLELFSAEISCSSD